MKESEYKKVFIKLVAVKSNWLFKFMGLSKKLYEMHFEIIHG